ncbi:MAG: UDP-glucose 4-epimerase GalE [Pirellulales bacterium]|nr:UDP-glucose 4-epimerase GalE [Pirellulales bacterium]
MNVLVAGGAGYIGSHAVRQLLAAGHRVVVVDNLFRGHREAVPAEVPFQQIDLADTPALADVLARHAIDCVMHFAALTYVGESVEQPLWYYTNNTGGSISMLRAMAQSGVKRFVLSSTAAVYGEPVEIPITESCPCQPINPYGRSKQMVERILADQAAADPQFAAVALRYFNVAGAAPDGAIGEDHKPETHLIPAILQAALGRRERLTIFGDDYPTPDGTCIRDYIHVDDLCAAHLAAMEALRPGELQAYNLGIGRGYSVREVFRAAEQVTGRAIPVAMGPRRAGDPAVLFADSQKIQRELGWKPRYTDVVPIVETAWKWFQAHPDGY